MRNMIICFLFLFLLIYGCSEKVDLEKEKENIMLIIKEYNEALLNSDIEEVIKFNPEGHVEISLGNGEIIKYTRADIEEIFRKQWKSGKYVKVEEMVDPIINISTDGKMAWIVGKLKLLYAYTDSVGVEKEKEMIDAYLWVIEKKDDKWISVASVESFKKD